MQSCQFNNVSILVQKLYSIEQRLNPMIWLHNSPAGNLLCPTLSKYCLGTTHNKTMRGWEEKMEICIFVMLGGLKSFTPTFKQTCSQCESQHKKIHRLYKFQSASNCSHKIVVALISATISILMLEHPDLTSWKTQHARNIKSMAAFIRVEQRSLSTRTNVLKVKWIYSTVTHSVCAPRRRRRMKKEGVTLDNMPTVETALSK